MGNNYKMILDNNYLLNIILKIDEITPQFGDVKFEVSTLYFKWQVRFDNSVGNCVGFIISRWIDSREFDISIGDALRQPK